VWVTHYLSLRFVRKTSRSKGVPQAASSEPAREEFFTLGIRPANGIGRYGAGVYSGPVGVFKMRDRS
jgi:hypothetical protein